MYNNASINHTFSRGSVGSSLREVLWVPGYWIQEPFLVSDLPSLPLLKLLDLRILHDLPGWPPPRGGPKFPSRTARPGQQRGCPTPASCLCPILNQHPHPQSSFQQRTRSILLRISTTDFHSLTRVYSRSVVFHPKWGCRSLENAVLSSGKRNRCMWYRPMGDSSDLVEVAIFIINNWFPSVEEWLFLLSYN